MASQEEKDCPGIVSAAKEEKEFHSRAFAAEEYKKSFASSNDKIATCVLGFVPSGRDGKFEEFSRGQNIVELMRETFDSEKLVLKANTVNGDDGNKEMYFLEHEMDRSEFQERKVPHEKASAERGASEETPKVKGQVANEDSVSENVLEVKKKILLEELEAFLLPEAEFAGAKVTGCKMVQEDFPIPRSLGIEVIDDTALIETIPAPVVGKKIDVLGYRKCTGKDAIKEIEARNGKRSRRKAKGAKNVFGMDGKNKSVAGMDEAQNLSGDRKDRSKRKYSRKKIEAVRFFNMVEQRELWKAIYSGLDTAVAKEYDNLAASSEHQKHIRLNYEPQQCFTKKKEAPAIFSAVCCENMVNELPQMDSNENVNPMDPSCGHSMGMDGCSVLEGECREDSDSEDDYDSIQKPAFLVDGEPNFDLGPPEDGWEYLRRVRWEAAQIPKVKVAKVDRSKLNKEQNAYIPRIPDIVKCPEHLLPLKQWEDVFLAEFSELRENLSQLVGSSIIHSRSLQPVHLPQLPLNKFGIDRIAMTEEVLLHNPKSPRKPIDQPILTAENKDTSENPILDVPVGQNSSDLPLLSTILGMDSVARVSMLQKRICLVEQANAITRNDFMWLFALCAMVDTPLDADTCAALRSLLRKCASVRATLTELDDQVVMLNILAAISGRYYGQAENTIPHL